MKVVRKFRGALQRQIAEGILILLNSKRSLNSKAEWYSNRLHRIIVEDKENEDYDADLVAKIEGDHEEDAGAQGGKPGKKQKVELPLQPPLQLPPKAERIEASTSNPAPPNQPMVPSSRFEGSGMGMDRESIGDDEVFVGHDNDDARSPKQEGPRTTSGAKRTLRQSRIRMDPMGGMILSGRTRMRTIGGMEGTLVKGSLKDNRTGWRRPESVGTILGQPPGPSPKGEEAGKSDFPD